MAKNYENIYSAVFTDGNKMNFGNSMIRGNGVPLDITEVYDSYNKAVLYALENPIAYEGQILAVTENGDTTVYVITPKAQGTITIPAEGESEAKEATVFLKKVGTAPVGDGYTIYVDEDGKISLAGISDLTWKDGEGESQTDVTKYQPVLKKDDEGNAYIDWEVPSATTVEGLDSRLKTAEQNITDAQGDIDALELAVGDTESGLVKKVADAQADITKNTEAIAQEVINRGEAITNLETTLKTYVGQEIGKQAHFSSKVVTNKAEMTDPTVLYLFKPEGADGKDVYEQYIVIDDVATLIGETSVDLTDYSTTTQVEGLISDSETKTNKAIDDVASDLSNFESEVAEGYATKQSVQDVADDVSELTGIVNGKAESSVVNELSGTVTDLGNTVASKVNKVTSVYDGEQRDWILLSPENQAKLAALTVGDTGNVEISGKVNADNVEGLESYITTNRDSVAGLLSTTNQSKLEGIAAGAQVNVIEAFSIASSEITPVNKVVDLPIATQTKLGVVLASADENKISIATDGTMEVNSINVMKLTQTEGDTLILDGGTSL